jgi:hypothetical protein
MKRCLSRTIFITTVFVIIPNVTFPQEDEKQIRQLIGQLGADDIKVREKAVDELITLGNKVKRLLEEAKSHNDPEVKWRAEFALRIIPVRERLGDKIWQKIPEVVKDIWSEDDFRKRVEVFARFLEDEKQKEKLNDAEVSLFAEEVVRGAPEEEVIEYISAQNMKSVSIILVKYLHDSRVCQKALTALSQLDAWKYVREYAKEITKLLEDKNPVIRRAGALALGSLGAKEHIRDIFKLLEDKVEAVRGAAVEALGRLQAKELAGDIVRMLEDKDRDSRLTGVSALVRLGAKEYANDIVKLLDDRDTGFRRFVINQLGELGAKDVLPELKKRFKKEKELGVRAEIWEAIEKIEKSKEEPKKEE